MLEESESSLSRPAEDVGQEGVVGESVGTGWIGDWKRRGAVAVSAWPVGMWLLVMSWVSGEPCVWCRQGASRLC
jgi:hypothetical protein